MTLQMQDRLDFYVVFGVEPTATPAEIQLAF
jgi:curved DNA-binding protein CbpA